MAVEKKRGGKEKKEKRKSSPASFLRGSKGGGRLRNPGGFLRKRGGGADRTGDLAVVAHPDLLGPRPGAEARAPPN